MLRRTCVNAWGMGVNGSNGLGRFQESPAWFFWDPQWGGNAHAKFEEPYYTRRMMGNNYRKDLPNSGTYHIPMGAMKTSKNAGRGGNPDITWASRKMKSSAIEVEATFVTCQGDQGGSINSYFTTKANSTGSSEGVVRHHMSWIAVPPDRTVSCKYCGNHFRRKPGWAPAFDENLLPDMGYIPTNSSLDPCLEGVKNGEAVPGAVKL